jgi:hypothetical protein
MPRYLLDKSFDIFEERFQAHDHFDPGRDSPTIMVDLMDWYCKCGPQHLEAEWNMMKIFLKWLLCGRLIGDVDFHVHRLSWGESCPIAFVSAVSQWFHDVNARGASPSLSDISHMSPLP